MFTFMRKWKETFSVTQQVVRTRNIRDVRLCILAVAMPTMVPLRLKVFSKNYLSQALLTELIGTLAKHSLAHKIPHF